MEKDEDNRNKESNEEGNWGKEGSDANSKSSNKDISMIAEEEGLNSKTTATPQDTNSKQNKNEIVITIRMSK